MSIRIETLEQLKNAKLLEKVLDRLRRTTRPRYFAFKKRCKVLGDKPLLLTAPPGRKLKSSLLRQVRLGSPTYKGIVHRDGQRLIFTFAKPVNQAETARWIAKCMHDAKSPVPLRCIDIRIPTTSKSSKAITEIVDVLPTDNILDFEEIENLPDIDSSLEETEELNAENMMDPPTLESLLVQYTSSKKLRWISETELEIQNMETQLEQLNTTIEELENRLFELETEMTRCEEILRQEQHQVEPAQNPWNHLLQSCQQTDYSLDSLRVCVDAATVNTTKLLQDLQFLSDNDEMLAFKLIREHCADEAQKWNDSQQSSEWKKATVTIKSLTVEQQATLEKLETVQQELETIENAQEARFKKYSIRKLDIYQSLRKSIMESSNTHSDILEVLNLRCEMLTQGLNEKESAQ